MVSRRAAPFAFALTSFVVAAISCATTDLTSELDAGTTDSGSNDASSMDVGVPDVSNADVGDDTSTFVPTGSCGRIVEDAVLAPSDGAPGQFFGWELALDGNVLLAGVPRDTNQNGSEAGAAYVFRRTRDGWAQEAKLVAGDGRPGDAFGSRVALSGDTAVVLGHGAPYLFTHDADGWRRGSLITQMQIDSVAISGDTIVLGSNAVGWGDCSSSGTALVFERARGLWSLAATLWGTDSACYFGTNVAVSGDTIAVGERTSIQVFVRQASSASGWTKQTSLDVTANTFGMQVALALAGDVAVLGVPGDDPSASGSAFVFERTGSVWTARPKLTAPAPADFGFFGWSVAVDAPCLLVGAPTSTYGVGPGHAHAFSRSDEGWRWAAGFASGATGWDGFGYGVALTDRLLAIGSLGAGENGNRGEIRVYRRERRSVRDASPPW